MKIQTITEQLDAALLEVTEAENALSVVLAELEGGPRAEKVTVSEKVAEAFTRLRAARIALSKLRDVVVSGG
jgi:hypothetical protein